MPALHTEASPRLRQPEWSRKVEPVLGVIEIVADRTTRDAVEIRTLASLVAGKLPWAPLACRNLVAAERALAKALETVREMRMAMEGGR